jgi:hypothetical protein
LALLSALLQRKSKLPFLLGLPSRQQECVCQTSPIASFESVRFLIDRSHPIDALSEDRSGTFPRQIVISTRCVGWREAAVGEWLANPYFYEAANDPAEPQGQVRHGSR